MTHALRRYRQTAGLTLDQLARRAGLTKSALSKIETGQHAPSLATVGKIIAATDGAISADAFLPAAVSEAEPAE